MQDDSHDGKNPRTFYGRRHGRKLRAGMRSLMDELLPEVAIPTPAEGEVFDPWSVFPADGPGRPRALHLEIGFGGGEHLAAQAKSNPDIGFIGAEPFINGVASLLRHIDEDGLENVRIFPDDVHLLLNALPPQSFERVYVLFADPWPKKRHAFRRIIQYETIKIFHDLLRDGGELRMATDDMPYLRWMFKRALDHSGLHWLGERPGDWLDRPADWPETRYEAKARRLGRKPVFLRFQKRSFDAI